MEGVTYSIRRESDAQQYIDPFCSPSAVKNQRNVRRRITPTNWASKHCTRALHLIPSMRLKTRLSSKRGRRLAVVLDYHTGNSNLKLHRFDKAIVIVASHLRWIIVGLKGTKGGRVGLFKVEGYIYVYRNMGNTTSIQYNCLEHGYKFNRGCQASDSEADLRSIKSTILVSI